MPENKLTIHKLEFDLELELSEEFKELSDNVSKFVNGDLTNELQYIINRYEIPEGKLIIKSLEIDIGEFENHHFERKLIYKLKEELNRFLNKTIPKIKEELIKKNFIPAQSPKQQIETSNFQFESDITVDKPILLSNEIFEEINLMELESPIDREHSKTNKKIDKKQSPIIEQEKQKKINISHLDFEEIISEIKKKPKEEDYSLPLKPIDSAFLYYIKYGRLPSNVYYKLGTSMVDIFNLHKNNKTLHESLKKIIDFDPKAKKRLINLLDKNNHELLLDKKIIKHEDLSFLPPKVPDELIDYFIALYFNLEVQSFNSSVKRYNLNDLIRFIYADNPQKLKSLIKFVILDYPYPGNVKDKIANLFEKLGKNNVVKIIASFLRKGAYVNKYLNQINRSQGWNLKKAHEIVLNAIVNNQDIYKAIQQNIENNNFKTDDFNFQPRIFLSEAPVFQLQHLTKLEIVQYYFTRGSIPFSKTSDIKNIEDLENIIFTLGRQEISSIKALSNLKFFEALNYETIGNLSERLIFYLINVLAPEQLNDLRTKYKYFEYNFKSGVPNPFLKSSLFYYLLKSNPKSYLEELVSYWRSQLGDSDEIIARRWKASEELEVEIKNILSTNKTTPKEELKVSYEFKSYASNISVKNAGLVILWPFLKPYFNLLDLLDDKGDFKSIEDRARACLLLQFLSVKQSYAEEFYLPLNKILTGYPLEETLPLEIEMTKKEIDVSNALLNNVIKQWKALGQTSIDNLRGSFLIRDGIISPSTNGWTLTVDKKAYDILLDKLPWGIGMIKLSWAPYVLNVEWERKFM